jgi:hypothetical protein
VHIPNLAIATIAFGAAGFLWSFFLGLIIAIEGDRANDGGARFIASRFIIGAAMDTAAVMLAAFILVMMRGWIAALQTQAVQTTLAGEGGSGGGGASEASAGLQLRSGGQHYAPPGSVNRAGGGASGDPTASSYAAVDGGYTEADLSGAVALFGKGQHATLAGSGGYSAVH